MKLYPFGPFLARLTFYLSHLCGPLGDLGLCDAFDGHGDAVRVSNGGENDAESALTEDAVDAILALEPHEARRGRNV